MDVEEFLQPLLASFNGARGAVDRMALKDLFNEQKFTDMVGFIMDSMNLHLKMKVGYVNSGGPSGAVAWVEVPTVMPIFGFSLLRVHQRCTVYLRKEFITMAPFDSLVLVIAHEMSHVVLDSIYHPLRGNEEAVDITAMILGYADFFVNGHRIIGYGRVTRLSTLSHEDVVYVARRIATSR